MARKKQMSPSAEERLARIEQALVFHEDDRKQAHEDRKELLSEIKDLRGAVDNLRQALQSSQSVLTALTAQQYGERISKLEEEKRALQVLMVNYPEINQDFLYWKKLLGTGFALFWKIVAMVVSSGVLGALATKWIH